MAIKCLEPLSKKILKLGYVVKKIALYLDNEKESLQDIGYDHMSLLTNDSSALSLKIIMTNVPKTHPEISSSVFFVLPTLLSHIKKVP